MRDFRYLEGRLTATNPRLSTQLAAPPSRAVEAKQSAAVVRKMSARYEEGKRFPLTAEFLTDIVAKPVPTRSLADQIVAAHEKADAGRLPDKPTGVAAQIVAADRRRRNEAPEAAAPTGLAAQIIQAREAARSPE